MNIKFRLIMEVFRKIKYFMSANVLTRTWIWIWRTIFCLRQRWKTDTASDLKPVSERSWLRQFLSTFEDRDRKRAPGLYLNQWWNIVTYLNHRNKIQWNRKRISYIFIQENAFENVVCEIAVILLMCFEGCDYCPACGAFDLGLAVSVPLPIVTALKP